jgi:hypothetical protein
MNMTRSASCSIDPDRAVGEDRPLVVALLDRARELRDRDDRDVEVARQNLQRARSAPDPVLGRGAVISWGIR